MIPRGVIEGNASTSSPKSAIETKTPPSRKRKSAAIDDAETCPQTSTENDEIEVSASADDEDQAVDKSEDDLLRTPRARKQAKTPLRRREKHGEVDDEDLGPAGLLPGLGTMFQPAVDWLSDDRRQDFAVWKKATLREIAAAG